MHKTQQATFQLTLAGTAEFEQGADVRLHHHSFLEIMYYLRGDIVCRISDRVFECKPGMLRLMPPGKIHGESALTRWAGHYIWVNTPQLPPWPELYLDETGQLGNLCNILVQEWNSQASDHELMADLALRQIDILLRRANTQQYQTAGELLVRECERLIRERFAAPLTINEIAETLGFSAAYVRAQFLRLRGETPLVFVQRLRVEHAIALIRHSDLSLDAIANLSGYDSASHLSRSVLRATGKRPGTFRME